MMQYFQNGNFESWMPNALPFMGLFFPLMILDIGLKGWGMWRAARMAKSIWFVALLLVNSMGILPGIFLIITNDEYKRLMQPTPADNAPKQTVSKAQTLKKKSAGA